MSQEEKTQTREKSAFQEEIDMHIGKRIRRRRRLMQMSQAALGEKVGVKFQQIQKHEVGLNRMTAARLFALSRALDVPITYFYDGLEDVLKQKGVLSA